MLRTSVVRTRRGFTLIETNVALFLLAIGFLGIAGLVLAGVNANSYNRNLSMADDLSVNLMEFWKSAEYAKVDSFLATCGTGCTARTYTTTATPTYGDSQLNGALTDWKQQVVQKLPYGKGTVTITKDKTTPYDTTWIVVTVEWKQKSTVYHSMKKLYRADV